MTRFKLACAGVLATGFLTIPAHSDAPHPLDDTIWQVSTSDRITRDALGMALDTADIVIVGEIHDNPHHHLAQAWVIDQIAPTGVAYEMIPEASEEGIAVFLSDGGDPGEIGPAIGWNRLGWPDWDIYRPVFEAGDPEVITGGAVPRSLTSKAIHVGAAAALGATGSRWGLDQPIPEDMQAEMEQEMIDAHCGHLPASVAGGMVEAQRLRDASFADAVLRARARSGGQAVLITGNGHARRDRGVPVYLRTAAPEVAVAVVGVIETTADRMAFADHGDPAGMPFDYVWFTAPEERPDPCAAFKQ